MKKYVSLIILSLILLVGCGSKSIDVAFVADLSGSHAQLGIDGRNGAQLAVAKINEAGGVNGTPITLIARDDKSDNAYALEIHEELASEGVEFVVGHLLSSMAQSVLESQSEQMLFVTPSMSTNLLFDRDDYVISTAPVNSMQSETIVAYCKDEKIDHMTVVYDLMNSEYTESLYEIFEKEYEEAGFTMNGVVAYDSRIDDMSDVSEQILELNPENLFLITQAMDTAFIMQYMNVRGLNPDTYSVSWSMTGDLLEQGGKAVEGIKFIGVYEPIEYSDARVEFNHIYYEQYGYEATFISVLCYDAVYALAEAMAEADEMTPTSVRNSFLEQTIVGLDETFEITEYGDSTRQYMLYELQDGEFIAISE